MNKKILLLIVIILAIGIAAFFRLNTHIYEVKQEGGASSEKEATYIIEGKTVTLQGGMAEDLDAETGTTVVTEYFGNEVRKDLNGDGREDVAFLLTQQPGGTGTFFYVVAALNTKNGYVGSSAFFLGDRIAPQTTESGKDGTILINYADRKPDEPFTARPSVGKSIWLLLDPQTMQLDEIAGNGNG